VTESQNAFFALDLGGATTSAALVARVAGHWRLLGAMSYPASAPLEAVLERLAARCADADPALAAAYGVADGAANDWARLTARSAVPSAMAVVAVSERSLVPLARVAGQCGWRIRSGSAEHLDPLAMTRLLLDPEVSVALVGAGEPPGADERVGLADLGALVAAVAGRRPELHVVLAGAMAEQLPRFEATDGRQGDVLLASAATSGTPPGSGLHELLDRLQRPVDDARRSMTRAVATLAEVLGRRVEAIDIGLDGGLRVVAEPGIAGEPTQVRSASVADAALAPPDPDDAIVDGVLGWSTAAMDRHRMRDRMRELRLAPWGDAAGEGAPFRLAAARAALARLVAATPELDVHPVPDLLVVAGGAFAIAPGPAIALAVVDVVRRPGVTQMTFDHARLLAALGAIADPAERRTIVADLADDLLVPLGTVVIPQGLRGGRSGGRLVVHGTSGTSEVDLTAGGLELVDLPPGESAVAEFQFRDPVRLGARGRHFAVDVAGGLGGLIVDLRDIPLRLPDRIERRRELLAAWQGALWAGLENGR
jgi:hypothetical protein